MRVFPWSFLSGPCRSGVRPRRALRVRQMPSAPSRVRSRIPLVPLPPDGFITRDAFTDFAELAFPVSRYERREDPETFAVEGSHLQLEYSVDGLELANLRLYRSYLQYFEGEGFEILFNGIGDDLGNREGYNFLRRTDGLLAPQPCGGFR